MAEMMESPQRTAGAAETGTESPEVEAHGESAGDGPVDGKVAPTPSTRHDVDLETGPKSPDQGSPKRRVRTTAKRTTKASTKSPAKASAKARDKTVARRPAKAAAERRFARDGEKDDESTEVVIDAAQLLNRLAEVVKEAEQAHVRVTSEQSARESLQAALENEHALRDKAERALFQAESATAELTAKLDDERAAREQTELDLKRVDEQMAILKHQVDLSWSHQELRDEDQIARRRWWRAGQS
jgi:hypothetical protein